MGVSGQGKEQAFGPISFLTLRPTEEGRCGVAGLRGLIAVRIGHPMD